MNLRDKTIEVLVKEDYQKTTKNINSQKKYIYTKQEPYTGTRKQLKVNKFNGKTYSLRKDGYLTFTNPLGFKCKHCNMYLVEWACTCTTLPGHG